MNSYKLNIDKSAWKLVTLGDVVFEPKETVKDLVAEGIQHIVGLEHIDSEDVHLRRSATVADANTFTKKFKKGDVLFGRRRAYLKKAAWATFDGICSGDITVLRANKALLPQLLPFIINNDKFFDYAIKHSAGGLSPRVKFKDLAEYQFLLPPKAQQEQLADLLWALDDVLEKEREVLNKLKNTYFAFRKAYIKGGISMNYESIRVSHNTICASWKMVKIKNVCKVVGGYAFKSEHFTIDGKHQVLRIGNITEKGLDLNKSPVFQNQISDKEGRYFIPKGAVVMSLTGTNGKRDYGFPTLMQDHQKYLLNQRLAMMIPKEEIILSDFLFIICRTEIFLGQFFRNSIGSANQANVSISDLGEIQIPVPPVEEQIIISSRLKKINYLIKDYIDLEFTSQALQKSLINQIF